MLKKILFLVLCVGISFAVHESAHFVAMQANGVEVEEMSLGIGPVLYQKQFDTFKFSIKIIPIMAYVKPSKAGLETLKKISLLQLLVVTLAGVFANLVLASLVFLWLKSREESQEIMSAALSLPKKLFFIFQDVLLEMVSFGRIMPKNKGMLVLNEVPCQFLLYLLFISVLLGIANLLPMGFLDGGKVFFLLLTVILTLVQLVMPVTSQTLNFVISAADFLMLWMFLTLFFRGVRTRFVVVLSNAAKKEEAP